MKQLITTLAIVLTTVSFAQVGIGTKTPAPTSNLDVTATNKGFLPPRLTTNQRNAITNPAQGLTIYNTTNGCLEFWNTTNWISACNGNVVSTCSQCTGRDVTTTIVDVTNSTTGKTWMDRNLGATRVAQDKFDVQAIGFYYQWGRCSDGHQLLTSTIYTANTGADLPASRTVCGLWDGQLISNLAPIGPVGTDWTNNESFVTEWIGLNAINNPCPVGYRLPTVAELQAELNTWSIANSDGAFASVLKLPVSGERLAAGLSNNNFRGHIWSDNSPGDGTANNLAFQTNSAGVGLTSNTRAKPVRCIKGN